MENLFETVLSLNKDTSVADGLIPFDRRVAVQLAIVKAEQAEVDAEYCADYIFGIRAAACEQGQSDGLSSYLPAVSRAFKSKDQRVVCRTRAFRASDIWDFSVNMRASLTKKNVSRRATEARPPPQRDRRGGAREPAAGTGRATKDRDRDGLFAKASDDNDYHLL